MTEVNDQVEMLKHVRYYVDTQIPDVTADSGVFFGDEGELYVEWEGSPRVLVIGPEGYPHGLHGGKEYDLGAGDLYSFLESVGDDLRKE